MEAGNAAVERTWDEAMLLLKMETNGQRASVRPAAVGDEPGREERERGRRGGNPCFPKCSRVARSDALPD